MIKKWFFALFKIFYIPYFYRHCCQKIDSLPPNIQLFFMTRGDFGTWIQLLHYIYSWHTTRGPTALVLLTGHYNIIVDLVTLICPQTILIGPDDERTCRALRYFGHKRMYLACFVKVYAYLVIDYPKALYFYYQGLRYPLAPHYSEYIQFFDKSYYQYKDKLPAPFVEAYSNSRTVLDIREAIYKDMMQLQTDKRALQNRLEPLGQKLKKTLGLPERYVVININCKDYSKQDLVTNRKKIFYPERYNVIIDYLLSLGWGVVIQGRGEQPNLAKRAGLVDYAHSDHCSSQNDLILFSGCVFSILAKTGPENFATLCGTPILGLNYVEPSVMTPNPKLRFFPKHLRKGNRYLSWQELLESPCFFDIGCYNFDPEIVYEELLEEELLGALMEFLPLMSSDNWTLTPLQKAFQAALTPLHLDQYLMRGAPLDVYLKKDLK